MRDYTRPGLCVSMLQLIISFASVACHELWHCGRQLTEAYGVDNWKSLGLSFKISTSACNEQTPMARSVTFCLSILDAKHCPFDAACIDVLTSNIKGL